MSGDHLYQTQDFATHSFVVLDGVLRLLTNSSRGTERLVDLLGPGDIVGTAAIEEHYTYAESVVAATEVQLMPLDISSGLKNELTRSAIAASLVRQVTRNRKTADDLGLPMNARIYRIISRLTYRLGTPIANEWYRLGFQLRHDDIAMLAGCARVTVTRVLGEMKEQGALEGARGRYNIRPRLIDSLVDSQVLQSL